MKNREKFLMAFVIGLIISLSIFVFTRMNWNNEEIESLKETEKYFLAEENISQYAKMLEQFIEENKGGDYNKLAVDLIVGSQYIHTHIYNAGYITVIPAYIDDANEVFLAQILEEEINRNYNTNYYELAERVLTQDYEEYVEEILTLQKTAHHNEVSSMLGFVEILLIISFTIYFIISIEYKGIKEYIISNLKVILVFAIIFIFCFICEAIILGCESEEYWNSMLESNSITLYYIISNILQLLGILTFWLVFVLGNIIKNIKNIRNIKISKNKNNIK